MNNITPQEFFNLVWERAKTKERSISLSGGCCYRNPSGTENHCFIGIAIPDEDYHEDLEGLIAVDNQICGMFPNIPIDMLCTLQEIHDSAHPDTWKHMLTQFAEDYKLEVPR